jgi:PIN domain nuclease of toxin-antitoxin system
MGGFGALKYLLDTHAALWIAESSPRLSAKVRTLARNCPADQFAIAAISLLEIARKARTGEIDLQPDPSAWLDDLGLRFTVLPLSPRIAWRSMELNWSHKDPADRLICATALEHQLTLITHDQEIVRWGGVTVMW